VAWALAPPVTAQIKNPIQAAKDVYKKARAEQQAKKPRQPSAAPGRLHCVSRWGQINVNSEHGGIRRLENATQPLRDHIPIEWSAIPRRRNRIAARPRPRPPRFWGGLPYGPGR